MNECKSTTHHTGCPCHEARRDAEIERLKDELSDLRRKIVEWASRISCQEPTNWRICEEMREEAGR